MGRLPALLLLLLAGCQPAPRPVSGRPVSLVRPDPGVARVIAAAADQVKPCYRAPRVRGAARTIVTELDVAYAADGTLARLPVVLAQRGAVADNPGDARALAEAAMLAVIRCAPARLPAGQWRGGWDNLRISFGRKAAA